LTLISSAGSDYSCNSKFISNNYIFKNQVSLSEEGSEVSFTLNLMSRRTFWNLLLFQLIFYLLLFAFKLMNLFC